MNRRPRFAARRALLAAALIAVGLPIAGCVVPPTTPPKQKTIMPDKPKMPNVPPRVATPIDPALQQRAGDEIANAFASSDPVLRAQALEATSRTNDPAAGDRILRGLADGEWVVRFAAAMCAGDLKHRGAFAALRAASADQEPSVRVAVRYALHVLGDKSLSKDLEAMSQNPDPRVRGTVAVVLGRMGEPTAIRILRPMLADPQPSVKLQVAEAMWRLGNEQGLENLIAGTVSPHGDDQVFCILALAGPKDQRVKDNILGKLSIDKDGKQYPEVQLIAARTLGILGDDSGFGVAMGYASSNDPRQRVLAALALGDIARSDGQSALAKLLNDNDASVRLAAATGLRQIGARR